ncbi:thioredoxin family protein [bacterium]|nr:thioredoxin family protein [bacterium]
MKKTLIIAALIFALPLVVYGVLSGRQTPVSETIIASAGMPRLIKFSSPMCSDCQTLAKIIDEVDDDYEGRVDFVEISVNNDSKEVREQIKKYNVTLVPTTIFLNSKGEQIARIEGSMPKEQLIEYLELGLK